MDALWKALPGAVFIFMHGFDEGFVENTSP